MLVYVIYGTDSLNLLHKKRTSVFLGSIMTLNKSPFCFYFSLNGLHHEIEIFERLGRIDFAREFKMQTILFVCVVIVYVTLRSICEFRKRSEGNFL